MFRIDVPQDIRKVKTKFIGPFSFREGCWLVIGGVCAYLAVAVQKKYMPDSEPNEYVVAFAGFIPAAIGFVKIMGMPIEKFFITSFAEIFLSKNRLLAEHHNTFREFFDYWNKEYEKEEERKLKERMKFDKDFRKKYKAEMKEQEKRRKADLKEYLSKHPAMK